MLSTIDKAQRGVHPEDIKAEIRKKYGSMTALSKCLKKSCSAISNTILQAGFSANLEKLIAHELGMKPEQVWPDRYHEDGTPISLRNQWEPSVYQAKRQRQKGGFQ